VKPSTFGSEKTESTRSGSDRSRAYLSSRLSAKLFGFVESGLYWRGSATESLSAPTIPTPAAAQICPHK